MTGPVGPAALGFGLGAIASLAASALLVTRIERLGEWLAFSEAMLGLVAALAADSPEITSAVTALARGQHDVGIGVVFGSNIFNLAALLGIGALIAGRIALHRDVVVLEGLLAIWVAGVSIATVSGALTPIGSLVLVLAVLVPYVYVSAMRPEKVRLLPLPAVVGEWLSSALVDESAEVAAAVHTKRGTPRDATVAAVALVVVVAASIVMERTATTLGEHAGLADIVIGAIVLATVTSLPNVVAAVYLARRGRGAATLSEALNSNTLNVAFGLTIPVVFTGLGGLSGPTVLAAAWYGGLTLFTLVICYVGRGLRRSTGTLVIAAYLAFLVVLTWG
ncbi:MAG TPA: hypothetical protein VEJ87_02720 [Acidimicrobiales bacterium]|nr:hypothetical protein [Acidimicrobiales bacterium]